MAKEHIDNIVYNEIILKMNVSVKVKSATDPQFTGDTITQDVKLCDKKWIRLYNLIVQAPTTEHPTPADWVIDPNSYLEDGTFKVFQPYDDAQLKSGDMLTIELPYYARGTHRATNAELRAFQDGLGTKTFPLQWLSLSPAIKQKWHDSLESLDRTSDLRMIFATPADFTKDFTKAHMTKWIEPLNALVEEFMATVKRNPKFYTEDLTYETIEYPRYGKESTEGIVSNILDVNLSAVELRLSLPIYKGKHCEC